MTPTRLRGDCSFRSLNTRSLDTTTMTLLHAAGFNLALRKRTWCNFAGSKNFTSARQLTLSLYTWHSLSLMHSILETCYVQIMCVRVIKSFWVLTGLQKSACGYRSFLCQYIMMRRFPGSLFCFCFFLCVCVYCFCLL